MIDFGDLRLDAILQASMFLLEDGGVTLEDTGFRDEDSILVEVRHNTEGTWPEEISSAFASATGTSNAGGADRRMSTMRSSTQVAGYKTLKTFLLLVHIISDKVSTLVSRMLLVKYVQFWVWRLASGRQWTLHNFKESL